MTVEAIKAAIEHLTETERHAVAEWLQEIEEQAWDAEMERDFSPAGRGHSLVDKINHDVDGAKFSSLEEGLRSRQKRN
jgi:hypothetical protein